MELANAKHEGYNSKYSLYTNGTRNGKRLMIVIGIMTGFGRKNYRDAVRKSWLPSGTLFLSHTHTQLKEDKKIMCNNTSSKQLKVVGMG
jgi:hypothetical protein